MLLNILRMYAPLATCVLGLALRLGVAQAAPVLKIETVDVSDWMRKGNLTVLQEGVAFGGTVYDGGGAQVHMGNVGSTAWDQGMSDHVGLSSTVRCGVLCVALLTGAPPLQAESWRPLGPGGGTVQALLLDPWAPRALYAAVNGGVYRSHDGGVSWVWRGQGLGNEMWDQ